MQSHPGKQQCSAQDDSLHMQSLSPPHTVTDSNGNNNISSPVVISSNSALLVSGHHDTTTSSATSAAARIRRRNRIITSCLECRRRKLRCDKSHPCQNCTKFRRECVFLSKDMDQASQLKLTAIKEKVGSLERLLERDVARSAVVDGESDSPATADSVKTEKPEAEKSQLGDEEELLSEAEDEIGLEPTPLASVDAAYEEGGEADDDLLDLGIQIGKMRITERIGGLVRPRLAEELNQTLHESINKGAPHGNDKPLPAQTFFTDVNYEFLKPGPSYIAPASAFFFSNSSALPSLMEFLPSRHVANQLIAQYFAAVHPIAKIVHRPTFERDYTAFWEEISVGLEPPPSLQTIIFAAMLSGVVSMDDDVISREFGVSKLNLIENFKTGTETALGRANFLRTTKVATLQGFVMYLVPLCREEISRAHSVLVGAAIRMAEAMGLHRDGEHYGLSCLETHVRRLIWYQLCFLDLRTCEAQGPRPTIRKEDFDTKFPGNYDDNDLYSTGPQPAVADRWTDATFSLIRFECNEMFRSVWIDRPRVDMRKISLTTLLAKVENFRKRTSAKYDHLINDHIPLQRAARFTKVIMLARLHIMILHLYHNSVSSRMPERLRKILITSCIHATEAAMALEIRRELSPWRWYVGAYTQYHQAMLLLVDTVFYGRTAEADRIWPCIDFVFNTDQSTSREERSRKILLEIQTKAGVYAGRRKMRAPEAMQKYVGRQPNWKTESDSEETFSPQFVGKSIIPLQPAGAVFAGSSNGEALWAVPNQNQAGSPATSSDAGHTKFRNMLGQIDGSPQMMGTPATLVPRHDDLMAEIDWEVFDAMFPPEQDSVDMYSPEFPSQGTVFKY